MIALLGDTVVVDFMMMAAQYKRLDIGRQRVKKAKMQFSRAQDFIAGCMCNVVVLITFGIVSPVVRSSERYYYSLHCYHIIISYYYSYYFILCSYLSRHIN